MNLFKNRFFFFLILALSENIELSKGMLNSTLYLKITAILSIFIGKKILRLSLEFFILRLMVFLVFFLFQTIFRAAGVSATSRRFFFFFFAPFCSTQKHIIVNKNEILKNILMYTVSQLNK